jgi:hypothetical protein
LITVPSSVAPVHLQRDRVFRREPPDRAGQVDPVDVLLGAAVPLHVDAERSGALLQFRPRDRVGDQQDVLDSGVERRGCIAE